MKRLPVVLLVMLTVGCAGWQKSCTQFNASSFGSDWIVVQYDATGRAFNCWKLPNTAVDNSDGGNVDWLDPHGGHLVHITGWENRVQVAKGDWESAARLLGVDASKCSDGVYPAPTGAR